jgi:hypothetical protein
MESQIPYILEKGEHASDSALDSFLEYFPFNFVEIPEEER